MFDSLEIGDFVTFVKDNERYAVVGKTRNRLMLSSKKEKLSLTEFMINKCYREGRINVEFGII